MNPRPWFVNPDLLLTHRHRSSMSARTLFISCLVLMTGCFRSTLVTFPPSRDITAIEISDAFAPGSEPLFTIKEPQRIDAIVAFLQSKQGRWDPLNSDPSNGKYRAAFVGDGV